MKTIAIGALLALACAGLNAATPDRKDNDRRDTRCYRDECCYRDCDNDDGCCDRHRTHCVWHPCHRGCQPGDCSYEHCRGYYEHIDTDSDRPSRKRDYRRGGHCCHR